MRAMKCDRCGKFYNYYTGSKTFYETTKANGIILADIDMERKHYSRKSYDLCPDCMKELEKFLNKKTK